MWWLLILLLLCLICYSWTRLQYFQAQGVKTLPPIPFLGNLTAVTLARENFVDTIATGYNKFRDQRYFGVYQYHIPTVVPRDPELIRQIMVRDFISFSDRGIDIPIDCDPLFGRNLIMLKGSKWRDIRAAILPAFSPARSRNMAPLMAECASSTVAHLNQLVGEGKEIDTDVITLAYVNDVIASCAFGFGVDSLRDPDNGILRLGKTAIVQDTTQIMKLFGYVNFPSFMKLLRVKVISTSDANQFTQLFKSAMKSRRENITQPRPDFIQILVDAVQGKTKHETKEKHDNNNNEDSANWTRKFSDEELVAQAVLFYSAGFDTTANLINFFLYEMAVNPGIQEKLVQELRGVDDGEDLYETVQGLEYLDMCVSEVLRLWPLVGSVDRKSMTTYDFGPTYPGSKHRLVVQPGVHVWLPIYSIQRDEQYWPNPNQCDPERFASGKKGDIVPYTYMPFGTGPRHCIGGRFAVLVAKVFLVKCLSRYQVRPGPNTPRPQKLAPRGFVLRPEKGFHLVVEPRTL